MAAKIGGKRKGLSFEEKRDRMLTEMNLQKEVYNLKEIEKFSVRKGIVLPTVKDVLLSLVSDNLVEQDKIGAGNFFWSLPSQAYATLKTKITEQKEKNAVKLQKKEELENMIEKSQIGKEPSDERTENLETLNALKQQYAKLDKQIQQYRRNDPDRLKELQVETEECRKKANVWTENIQYFQEYVKKFRPDISAEDFANGFDMPENFIEEI